MQVLCKHNRRVWDGLILSRLENLRDFVKMVKKLMFSYHAKSFFLTSPAISVSRKLASRCSIFGQLSCLSLYCFVGWYFFASLVR